MPNPNDALVTEAMRHAAARNYPAARSALASALASDPGDANALVQLSYVESLEGHYRAARQAALRAEALHPRDEAVLTELVRRLRTFNEAKALHRVVARLPPLSQVSIPLLLVVAAQLSYLNEQDEALRLLDEARRADPEFPPSLVARAQVLSYLGRLDEAEADLVRCLSRAPELAQARWVLSRLRRVTPQLNHLDGIRRYLARPKQATDDIVLLAYALHKEADDLGDIPLATEGLDLACRAKRSTVKYDPAETVALVDALIAMQIPVEATSNLPRDDDHATPVFIVGMHRSGTTLLEQFLDGHPALLGVGELYDFTTQMRQATDHHCRGVIDRTIVERAAGVDFAPVGAGYLAGIAWRLEGHTHFTDKLPSNFLNLGFILRALPHAKSLHMVRDPMETCFSNLRELFSDANPYSYDQAELGAYHVQYQRLMAHWHARFPGRIHDVHYDALTRMPAETLGAAAAFCGLDVTPEMMDLQARTRAVATASAMQVREGVVARTEAKWLPYATYLAPLRRALGSADPAG